MNKKKDTEMKQILKMRSIHASCFLFLSFLLSLTFFFFNLC